MQNPDANPVEQPVTPAPRRRFGLVRIFLGVLALAVVAGAVGGFFSGQALRSEQERERTHALNVEQFNLAHQDILEGRFNLALDRLESILGYEPDFPGAADLREEALAGLNATPTPQPTNTPIPSATPDAPRAEQLLTQARQYFTDKNYPGMINTLLSIKAEMPSYHPEIVDGLLWVGLRYHGVDLIKNTNRLTEGMYYLDLAAGFAPLDDEALGQIRAAQTFLNVFQSAYYYRNKDKEVSLSYFEQAIAIRRYYSDTLVWDYVNLLVEVGDIAMGQDPCHAWDFYDRAVTEMPDYQKAIEGRKAAENRCGGSGAPPAPSETEAAPTEPEPTAGP